MNGVGQSQERAPGVPAGIFVAAVLLTLAVLSLPFASAWSESPDLGHGWALPWLIGWLMWERRAAIVPAQPFEMPWYVWGGLAGLAVDVLFMRLLLGAYPLLPTVLWGLGFVWVFFALGAAALFGGKKAVRVLAVPVILILAGLPWPSVVENAVVLPLRETLTTLTVEVLNAAGVPSLANGTVIQVPGGTVGVDEACGGMRSLQASLMIAIFVGEVALLGWGRRIALLGLSVATAVVGNLFRVGVLTCAANSGGEARLQAWHDPAGYLALICTLLVIGVLGWRWGGGGAILAPSPSGNWSTGLRVSKRKLAWAMTALAMVASIEIFVQSWYGVRNHALAAQPEWRVAWPMQADGFHADILGPIGVETLNADDYAAASWRTPAGGERSAYAIEWRTGQKARCLSLLHSPDICLPMMGSQLIGRFDVPPVRVGVLTLPFNGLEFRREGKFVHIFTLLWDMDEARAFVHPPVTQGWLAEFRSRWRDVCERRARVRVQLCTYQVTGMSSHKEAAEVFRREMEGGFIVAAPASVIRAKVPVFGQIHTAR